MLAEAIKYAAISGGVLVAGLILVAAFDRIAIIMVSAWDWWRDR